MLTWSFMTPFARGPAKIMNSPSQYTLKGDCTVEKAAIVAEVGATCFRRSCSTPSRESPRMMVLIHRCDDVLAKPVPSPADLLICVAGGFYTAAEATSGLPPD